MRQPCLIKQSQPFFNLLLQDLSCDFKLSRRRLLWLTQHLLSNSHVTSKTSCYLKLRATLASQCLWVLLVSETREVFVRLNMKNSTKKIVVFLYLWLHDNQNIWFVECIGGSRWMYCGFSLGTGGKIRLQGHRVCLSTQGHTTALNLSYMLLITAKTVNKRQQVSQHFINL